MKKYLIGLDIGTTNIKGSLYGDDGSLLSIYSYAYDSFSLMQNYHEQNPSDWLRGILIILKNFCSKKEVKNNIEAISFSTQGGTLVIVDKFFKPICNAITWLDRRGIDLYKESEELSRIDNNFYQKTGWRIDSSMGFLPLYWIRKNKPELFSKIHKVLFVNDYISYKLCGKNIMDPSSASISGFYNIKEGKWDDKIIKFSGLGKENFSKVYKSGIYLGNISANFKKKLGITKDIKLINGGHDQYCSALGAGILDENDLLISAGTAWVVFKLLKSPKFDNKSFFSPGRSIINNKFGIICSIPSAGASLNWFAKNIMNLKNDMDLVNFINKNSERFLLRQNKIVFYPFLTGSLSPDFEPGRTASFKNLEIGHDHIDLVKSILEGICFQLKRIIMKLEEKKIKFDIIKMVGGGSKSKVWPNILADIINKDILVPTEDNESFATIGAAIIAGYGSGIFNTIEDGYSKIANKFKVVMPNNDNQGFYKNKFLNFLNNNWKE